MLYGDGGVFSLSELDHNIRVQNQFYLLQIRYFASIYCIQIVYDPILIHLFLTICIFQVIFSFHACVLMLLFW